MPTVSLQYATPITLTITLASLASDTNLIAGRISTAVDNSTRGRRHRASRLGGRRTRELRY